MGRLYAVEVIYRGIFQKTLCKNITRALVLAAHREGKHGISFGRYGDSPERNGIPAKGFAIIADDEVTLEEGMAKYEPKEVDVTICVDDTLCKGIESWAWYGLQPVNKLLKPGGTLIVTSLKNPEELAPIAHRKEHPYRLAMVRATPSFSGLWVYKDDHTDVRILGMGAWVLTFIPTVELANPYWFYPKALVHRQTCRHAQPTPTAPASRSAGSSRSRTGSPSILTPPCSITRRQWLLDWPNCAFSSSGR